MLHSATPAKTCYSAVAQKFQLKVSMCNSGFNELIKNKNVCLFSDRPSVEECLNHPWLNTEELFQRSPVRKSRRSCGSEQKQKRKKLKKMQQQNGVTDGECF